MEKLIKYLSLFVVLFMPSNAFANELEITPVDICSSNSGTLKTFQVVGYILYIIKILVPIILIVICSLDFGRAVISKDEKAILYAANYLVNRIIIGVLIFMIPTLLQALLYLVNDAQKAKKGYETCTTCLLSPFSDECVAKDLTD